MAAAAHAELITVTVTGEVVVVPDGVAGISVGTPYTWTATYDSSIASSPVPYLTNVAEANSILDTSLTIGSFSWTGQGLYMGISCCSSIPTSYYDTVGFYANSSSGPTLASTSGGFAPAYFYYLFDKPANVLSSTATPSAAQLALVPPDVLDFRFNSTTQQYQAMDILGGGGTPQVVTISGAGVPEPATLGLLLTACAVLAACGGVRRMRSAQVFGSVTPR
ncbi:MAG: PEP-CTERM sorting domain-containing protein [Gammaproteobacteria bacterium]|nr:PEP-CTERM sorting domain-containing protein [Gammaproteobacteria bacterium]MBV8404742.1 PEP-CTERM sorting domain-containing protein [Gammaproteobacteria bacterium]